MTSRTLTRCDASSNLCFSHQFRMKLADAEAGPGVAELAETTAGGEEPKAYRGASAQASRTALQAKISVPA